MRQPAKTPTEATKTPLNFISTEREGFRESALQSEGGKLLLV